MTSRLRRLRTALSLLTASALLIGAWATPPEANAAPRTLTVQGYLTTASGEAAGGDFTLLLSLYTSSTAPTSFWDESHTMTLHTGVFDAVLGADVGNPLTVADFADNDEVWLEVTVLDGPGVPDGGDAPLPRRRLSAIGFAFAAGHAETADVASHAGSADTATTATTATTANGLSCAGCVTQAHLGFDPATQAELQAALAALNIPSSVEGFTGGEITGDVTVIGGVVASAFFLAGGIPVCTAAGNCGYVNAADLAQALSSYATSQDLATAVADLVSTAQLNTALATVARLDDIPTSLDGLAGGTVTSAVTVQTSVDAAVVRQGGHVVCDQSGNCGQTLAGLACSAHQTIRYDGELGRWVCSDASSAGPSPGIECSGEYKVLQWTGSEWLCRDLRQSGLSTGSANGWEIVDNWGDAWDALERPPLPWADALDACVAEGGRLPTVTELWRNRASAGGTGNLADVTATRALWAHNPDYAEANRRTVTLSNGNIGRTSATSALNFRCIWPSHHSDAFDGNSCFGPPGAECGAKDLVWHVDRFSRPPLDASAAAWECRFHHASLMDLRTYQEIIQGEGFDHHETTWHWVDDHAHYTSGGYGMALVMSATSPNPHWGFDTGSGWGNEGSYSAYSSVRQFRCMGKRDASIGTLPTPSCVDGDCFTVSQRNGVLVADNQDRAPVQQHVAAHTCAQLGGRLPNAGEFFDLVQSGWENGSNVHLWLGEVEYYYHTTASNTLRYPAARWPGTGGPWMAQHSTYMTISLFTSIRPYRCIWGERFEGTMTECAPDEVAMWDGAAFQCVAAVDGSVSNQDSQPGNLPPFHDAWGNAWDLFQRPSASFADATATCGGVGGRLPTVTELWRVRFNQPLSDLPSLGQSTDTDYQWTIVPSPAPGFQVISRLSDGASTHANTASASNSFRCVWPTTKGDAFGGRSCYGHPTDPCFTVPTLGLRMDRLDRGNTYAPSAAWECRFYGGRLPKHRELQELIHAGLPNGSGEYLSLAEPAVWGSSNGSRGTHKARFLDGHETLWAYAYSHGLLSNYRTAAVHAENSNVRFRCVYSDHLD